MRRLVVHYLTLHRGDPSGTYDTVRWTATSGSFGDKYGVTHVGDLDGDGLDDLVAAHNPYSGSVGAYVLLGDTTPASDTLTIASDAWYTA
ncbi:MAG: hypothetical protein ACK4YP_11785, partial [Myxococcota bacterium]